MQSIAVKSPSNSYRPDIDGLRAIAVIPVVLFHAFPGFLPGGFVGVDVFFVISGFLISSIFFKELDRGVLDTVEFYRRRIRRIFPALITVLTASLIVGWFVLLPNEYIQLGRHVVASAGFVENFLLWSEVGYFDTTADMKPLLHIWSLGIEEQFYIVWPLLLWIGWKQRANLLFLTAALTLFSFVTNIVLIKDHATAVFYFPVTRFWELLVGAMLAHLMLNAPTLFSRFCGFRSLVGLAMLTWSIATASSANFPGWQAIIPTIGTALLISSGQRARINMHLLSLRPMIWIGLISYPLYLWHWPILVFARTMTNAPLSFEASVSVIALSIALSWVTLQYIERPIRGDRKHHAVAPLAAALSMLVIAGLIVRSEGGFPSRTAKIEAFNGPSNANDELLSSACAKQYAGVFTDLMPDRDICLTTERHQPPNILVMGDSHAFKLYEAMVSLGGAATILGRGSCAPILGAPSVEWLKCQRINDRILDYATHSDASLLILTGVFGRYFDGTYGLPPSDDQLDRDVKLAFSKLGASTKQVLIVIDNPKLPFDSTACVKRPLSFSDRPDCSFDRSNFDRDTKAYKERFMQEARNYSNIQILDPSNNFCDSTRCFAYNSEGLVYSGDNNHLNARGAAMVGRAIMKLYRDDFSLPTITN